MKIKLIGNYPPPIGGISIHIERMVNRFLKDNIEVIVYDDCYLPKPSFFKSTLKLLVGKFTFYVGKRFHKQYKHNFIHTLRGFKKLFLTLCFTDRKTENIIFYHTKNWKYRAALCLTTYFNKKNKVLITIHSMRDVYKDLTFSDKIFAKFSIKVADHFIVTNLHIKDKLAEWGTDENKITVIAPFLPPDEKESDFEEIPEFVWNFINNHSPVISANAFQLKFYKNEDLYGLDMCVELCDKLVKRYTNIGFVFCLPVVGDEEYFEKINTLLLEKNIEKNFLFLTSPYMFYPILKNSDLFLRPTNTDGDALSIREALHYNIPAIASDVIRRPPGTILFINRNHEDLYSKTKIVLDNIEEEKHRLKMSPQTDNYIRTMEVIKSLLNN